MLIERARDASVTAQRCTCWRTLATIEFQALRSDLFAWEIGLSMERGVAVASRISRKIVTIVAIAAAVIIAAIVSLRLSDRTELDNSVNALKEALDSDYEVERKQFGNSVTDLSGIWSVRSSSELTEKLASKAGFSKADEDDLRYFKQ